MGGPGLGGPGGGIGGPGMGGGLGGPGGTGGAEINGYTPRRVPVDKVTSEMEFAQNLYPARAALVVGAYPHLQQTEEIAKALRIEKSQVTSLYQELRVQRRWILTKGTRLADGTIVAEDMVYVPDPKNPAMTVAKPYREVNPNPTTDKENFEAGWYNINMREVGKVLDAATEIYVEPDPIYRGLIATGDMLAMRLPNPVRGKYPDVFKQVQPLKETYDKIQKDYQGRIPPRKRDPRLPKDDGSSPFGSGGGTGDSSGSSKDDNTTNREGNSSAPADPEYCVVRFLDLDLPPNVGGLSFEYRVRVVLLNPNYNSQEVAVPEFAKDKELFGKWSAPARMTFPPDYYIYADERVRPRGTTVDRDTDKAPIQIHHWFGVIQRDTGLEARIADWWVDRTLATKGEYIGRVPSNPKAGEIDMAVWVAYAKDTVTNTFGLDTIQKVRSVDLMTQSILVDFEGGSKVRYRSLAGKNVEEDVPVHALIVEPNGRIIARSLTKDKALPERKERFETWEKWFNSVKNRATASAPAAPSGGSGGGGDRFDK